MGTIFQGLLTISLSASVIVLLIFIIRAALGSKMKPLAYYILWSVLILRLLLPFAVESQISIYNSIPTEYTALLQMEPGQSEKTGKEAALSAAPEEGKTNITAAEEAAVTSIPAVSSLPTDVKRSESSYPLDSKPQSEPLENRPVNEWDIAGFVWLAGFVAAIVFGVLVNIRFAREIRHNREISDPSFEALLTGCRAQINLKIHVQVRLTDKLSTPAVWGIFKPKLLIPRQFFALSENEQRCVLMHELNHIKYLDTVKTCGMLLLKALHWFNPVLWLGFKAMRRDMETICDYNSLKSLGSKEEEYAATLIAIAKNMNADHLGFLMAAVDKKTDVKRRIRMVMQYKKTKVLATAAAILLAGIIAVAGCTSAVTPDIETVPENVEKATAMMFEQPAQRPLTAGETETLLQMAEDIRLREPEGDIVTPFGRITLYVREEDGIAQYSLYVYDGYKDWELSIKKGGTEKKWWLTPPAGFSEFIQSVMEGGEWNAFTVYAYPKEYTLEMSSMPGIQLSPQYAGAKSINVTASDGKFIMWTQDGKLSELGKTAAFSDAGGDIYWTPGLESESGPKAIYLTFTAIDEYEDITGTKTVRIDYDGSYYSIANAEGIVIGEEPESAEGVTVERWDGNQYSQHLRIAEADRISTIKDILAKVKWQYGVFDVAKRVEYRLILDEKTYEMSVSEDGYGFFLGNDQSCFLTWEEGALSIRDMLGLGSLPVYNGSGNQLLHWVDETEDIAAIKEVLAGIQWRGYAKMSGGPDYLVIVDDQAYALWVSNDGLTIAEDRGNGRLGFLGRDGGALRLSDALGLADQETTDDGIQIYGVMQPAVNAVLNSYTGKQPFVVYALAPFDDGTLVLAGETGDGEWYPDLFYVDNDNKVASRTKGSYCWTLNFTIMNGKRIYYGLSHREAQPTVNPKSQPIEQVVVRFTAGDMESCTPYPENTVVAVKNGTLSEKDYGKAAQGYIHISQRAETPVSLDMELQAGKTVSVTDLILQVENVPDYLNLKTPGARSSYAFQYNPMLASHVWNIYREAGPAALENGDYGQPLRPSGVFRNTSLTGIFKALSPFAFSYNYLGNSFPAGGKIKLIRGEGFSPDAKITCTYSPLTAQSWGDDLSFLRTYSKPDAEGNIELLSEPGYYLMVVSIDDPAMTTGIFTYTVVIKLT